MKGPKRKKGSEASDEWGTPPWLFAIIEQEFPELSLDVCASDKNHKLSQYYTLAHNGLTQRWDVPYFCNPPYSKILPWVTKAAENNHTLGVHLVKYDPSTRHGCRYAEYADELRILEHRIAFENAVLTANFPVMIAVFRERLYTRKTNARVLYVNYKGIQHEAS